ATENGTERRHIRGQVGDRVVLDRADPSQPIAHFIPKSALGATGNLYIYIRNRGWRRLVHRRGFEHGWHDAPHLHYVEGEHGDLLVMDKSPRNRSEVRSGAWWHDARYKYLRGSSAEDGAVEEDWYQVPLVDWSETAASVPSERENIVAELHLVLSDRNWFTDDTKFNTAKKCLLSLFEESVPGPTFGLASGGDAVKEVDKTLTEIKEFTDDPSTVPTLNIDSDLLSDFQTGHASIATFGMVIVSLYRLLKHSDKAREKYGEEEYITRLGILTADYNLMVAKSANQVQGVANIIEKLADFTWVEKGAFTLGEFVLQALGPAISLVGLARQARKAYRADRRLSQLQKLSNSVESAELDRLFSYVLGKLWRKEARLAFTAYSSAISVSSGVTAIVAAAAVTTAAVLTPVGWVLGGASLAAGLGVTLYSGYRRVTRKGRHANREQAGIPATPEDFAGRLIDFYNETVQNQTSGNQLQLSVAQEMLEIFGVTIPPSGAFSELEKEQNVQTITRHLQ
ncbi:MAG: hypothetical protein JSW66_07820, partial [Phycisphaerales bacterium]